MNSYFYVMLDVIMQRSCLIVNQ